MKEKRREKKRGEEEKKVEEGDGNCDKVEATTNNFLEPNNHDKFCID